MGGKRKPPSFIQVCRLPHTEVYQMISTCSGLEKSPLATGCNRPMTTTKRSALPLRPIACLLCTWQKNACGQPPRSSEEEAGGSKPRGPEATLRTVRMKRTPRVKLRVPLAPRVPFHTVMPPDFYLKRKKEEGKYSTQHRVDP